MKDTKNGYSAISISLHWIVAITVISLFVLGEMAEDATDDDRNYLLGLHISIAASMAIILWGRIVWRLFNVRPTAPQQSSFLMLLAKWVPNILLIAIAVMLISGPIMVWTKGYPISIFELLTIPSPFGEREALHEAMEWVHKTAAKVLFVTFILHFVGVIKHLIIDRDNSLIKILKPGNKP